MLSAGRVIAVPKLIVLAEQAEGTDWWLAARLFKIAHALTVGSEGQDAATPYVLKCLDALKEVEASDMRDDMELQALYELIMAGNVAEIMARSERVVAILTTGAKDRDPIVSCVMSQMIFMDKVMAGDRQVTEAVFVSWMRGMLVDGQQHPDPTTRTKCLMLGAGAFAQGAERLARSHGMQYNPTVSIWDFLGQNGETVLEATEEYDFGLYLYIVQYGWADVGVHTPHWTNWLLIRSAHVTKAFEWMERALGYQRRAIADATPDTMKIDAMKNILVAGWASACFNLRLPSEQRAIAAAMLAEHDLTWNSAGEAVDAVMKVRGEMFRPRGDASRSPAFFIDPVAAEWRIKVRLRTETRSAVQ